VTSTIFKRILLSSKKFMQLRVLMRNDYRNAKMLWESATNKINRREFKDKADTQFNNALALIVAKIKICHTEPEQKVFRQNETNNGKMCVILNGVFDVFSLTFTKSNRTLENEQSIGGRPPGSVR